MRSLVGGQRSEVGGQSVIIAQSKIQNPKSKIESAPPTPQLAPLGPLVADQIDLDPSITQIPALPRPKIEPAPPVGPILPGDGTFTDGAFTDGAFTEGAYTAEQQAPADAALPSPPTSILPEPAPQPELPPTKAWPYPAGLIEQLNIRRCGSARGQRCWAPSETVSWNH